jgi:hypothetical protein
MGARMTRRNWILLLALVLVSGPFLKDLVAKSVDRFAIWDSTLTNPVVVTNTTPGGSDYGAVTRIAGTPAVSISGTPSVSISGTPSVLQSGPWTVQPGNTPNTTPWLFSLTDTVGSTTALNALNVAASVAMAGQKAAVFFLASGTLAATLTPEVSLDGGTTWSAAVFVHPTTGVVSLTSVHTNPNSATAFGIITPTGTTHSRVRVSSFTSGTANGTLRATTSALAGLYGSDGTTLRAPIVKNSAPSGSEYGIVVWPQGTLTGSITDGGTFTRGSSAAVMAGCVYETSDPTLVNGKAYGIRCNSRAFPIVTMPDSGTTPYSRLSTADTNAITITGSAAVLYGCQFSNSNAAARWAKIYDLSGTPTSSDTPKLRVCIPGTANGCSGNRLGWPGDGVHFSTGIGHRFVTGVADNDNTGVALNEIVANCQWRAAS